MSQVVPPESGDHSTPQTAANSQPRTPPTNPTNSSEPTSPSGKPSSDNPSSDKSSTLPTNTQTSTVTEPTLIPQTESRVAESSRSDTPGPASSPSPSAEFHDPATSVATPVPTAPTDSKPNPNTNVLHNRTSNSVTNNTQHTATNPEHAQPVKGESLLRTEQTFSDPAKSEATTVETHPESDSSHQQQNVFDPQNLQADVQHQTPNLPKSAPKNPPPAPRPNMRRLPKVAKNRPDNARVFIGNLASEYTSCEDIVSIFQKYGHLIEEPVLRRSFGFVQYSTAEAALKAVKAEQGRVIGGIGIDLSIADNREVKKGTHVQNNTPFQHAKAQHGYQSMRGRVRERENAGAVPEPRKKRRSESPTSASRKGGVHPPQYRRYRPEPKNGVYLRILCMSPTAKGYAKHCENTFRTMTGLKADILHILAAGLGEALGRAMRDTIPYVMVVASKDVEDGTCTIRTLEKTGYEKSGRGNGVIPLREAVEVCLIERGVIAPANMAQNMGPPGSLNRAQGAPGGGPPNSRPQQGGSQWLNQSHHMANQLDKPGWMTGPRPPHPANQGGQRPPSHPPSFPPAGPPGYGYNEGRPNYGHGGLQRGGTTHLPTSHMQSRPDGYGRGVGGPHAYEPPPGDGPGPNVNHEYGRGGHPQPYQAQIGHMAGYQERHGQEMSRGGNYGPPSGRETEYDPANITPSHSGPQAGGYPSWNRGQGPGVVDSYNNGVQELSAQQPSNYMPNSEPFPTQQHRGNVQGYGNRQNHPYAGGNQAAHYRDQQPPSYNARSRQGGYDSYDGSTPYRRDQRYSNDGYSGSNTPYQPGGYQLGGYQPRDNGSGWDQQQSSSMGPTNGMPNAPPPGYGPEPVHQPQSQNHGYGEDFRNAQNAYDGSRPSDNSQNQYNVGNSAGDMRDPRSNQRYSAEHGSSLVPSQPYHGQPNSGGNIQSQVPAHAPVSGAGTVDIDKLTNLISAFQQKQQQNSQQQARSQRQQQQQPQQHQPQRHQQTPQGQSRPGTGHGGHSMQGDRQGGTPFLQMHGVQQTMQSNGGAGVRGYQGGYQQGMVGQNSGMGGPIGQNRGPGSHQGIHPTQNYYG